MFGHGGTKPRTQIPKLSRTCHISFSLSTQIPKVWVDSGVKFGSIVFFAVQKKLSTKPYSTIYPNRGQKNLEPDAKRKREEQREGGSVCIRVLKPKCLVAVPEAKGEGHQTEDYRTGTCPHDLIGYN